MNGTVATTPEAALHQLRALPTDVPIIVDLDETLLLDGSVECFIACAWPKLPARVLMILLDRIKPWRWTGGPLHRDLWRIGLISVFFPWIWARWRRQAPMIAAARVNQPLLHALAGRHVMVATHSYRPIAEPLVTTLLPNAPLVACALGRRDRELGKPAQIAAQQPGFPVAQAAVITDSTNDQALLATVAYPLLVVWPQARVTPAFEGHYLPLYFTEGIRRKGQRYFIRCIAQEDFGIFLFAALPLMISLPYTVAGLCFLLISFWCVYEQGYVDNEHMAERYENPNPRPPGPAQRAYGRPYLQAGLWSLLLALPGAWLVARGQGDPDGFRTLYLSWLALLGVTALSYRVYNRVDPQSRVWLFPGLQTLRAFGMVVVVPITVAGALMLLCHVVMRQVDYYLYRKDARDDHPLLMLLRLELFVLLVAVFALSTHDALQLPLWHVIPLVLWGLFRARNELGRVLRQIRWLPRTRPHS